ncbi:MAG: thioredoxin family protein [Pirellulaceae bacterium]
MDARLTRIVAMLLIIAGGLLAGCGTRGAKNWDEHTQGLPFVVGYDKGMNAAAAENKPVMMFVTTTWCGWCKKLAEENFHDAEVKELLSNFVCVIVDGDVETAAAQKLGASGYPHIVFLSAKGEKLGENSGYAPVAEFKSVVQKALDKSRDKG